jgi:hypothetical protein
MNKRMTKGNRLAITSGLSSYLSTGRWPKGASYVQRLVSGLRRGLEYAIAERGIKAEEYAVCLIQSACRHEARALLLQRKLRNEVENLTTDQYLAVLRDLSAATDARDRCLKGLRLDEALKPLSVTDCPQCGLSYFGECKCAIPPAAAAGQPVAEDDAGQAISASDGQEVAGPAGDAAAGQGATAMPIADGDREPF